MSDTSDSTVLIQEYKSLLSNALQKFRDQAQSPTGLSNVGRYRILRKLYAARAIKNTPKLQGLIRNIEKHYGGL